MRKRDSKILRKIKSDRKKKDEKDMENEKWEEAREGDRGKWEIEKEKGEHEIDRGCKEEGKVRRRGNKKKSVRKRKREIGGMEGAKRSCCENLSHQRPMNQSEIFKIICFCGLTFAVKSLE